MTDQDVNDQDANSKLHAAPQTGGVRFAPSPTGRFHIGNLRTAWISWKFAQTLKLPWVVRFEDIDRPRVLPGAQELQSRDMKDLGMKADQTLIQSELYRRHFELFERARKEGAIYACDCSRKDVQQALAGLASAPHDGRTPVYSGHCRHRASSGETVTYNSSIASLAWRMRMPGEEGHNDIIIARTSPSGDHFVPAYHWACAIDDYDGAYDLLVRSSDLAHAVPIQRGIQAWLMKSDGAERPFPKVFHTSLITQNDGHRLEKRTLGVTLDELRETGSSAQDVMMILEKSFNSSYLSEPFDDSGLLSEEPTELKLSEIGIRC
jgi:glutamyl-tRNA synthetase